MKKTLPVATLCAVAGIASAQNAAPAPDAGTEAPKAEAPAKVGEALGKARQEARQAHRKDRAAGPGPAPPRTAAK